MSDLPKMNLTMSKEIPKLKTTSIFLKQHKGKATQGADRDKATEVVKNLEYSPKC